MENENFLKAIESYFGVHESDNDIELETWTEGGANMFINLSLENDEELFQQFQDRVNEFEVDEEIDVHRQDERYKDAFSIRESVIDFESYEKWLISIVHKLEDLN